ATLNCAAAIRAVTSPAEAVAAIRADLDAFRKTQKLDDLVVVNVASTEPPFALSDSHERLTSMRAALDRGEPGLHTSGRWAAAEAGFPYVNLTPSLGGSYPAFEELCAQRRVPHAGQDAKTGETLVKTVLAPLFARRNLKVLSWVGHNILGNRDGQVLADPA